MRVTASIARTSYSHPFYGRCQIARSSQIACSVFMDYSKSGHEFLQHYMDYYGINPGGMDIILCTPLAPAYSSSCAVA